jgi:glycosyltransferase involved in cell wall biosynthesis
LFKDQLKIEFQEMNILWITNTIFPDACAFLGRPVTAEGGWMYVMASALSEKFNLAIASVYDSHDRITFREKSISYYLLPARTPEKYVKRLEKHFVEICSEFRPDIIHIHGTELAHGLACLRACPEFLYVISIQGMTGAIGRYYFSGLNYRDILKNLTFRDILRFDTIFNGKMKFDKRAAFEIEYLKNVDNVIGRTSWDYAQVTSINPRLRYHFCNESLRTGFYIAEKWQIRKKEDFSIFLSQSSYPIKGLHQVLKAAALLRSEFPCIKVRVAGPDIIDDSSLSRKIRMTGYGSYIRSLIKNFKLDDAVEFTGILQESQMIAEYQRAHIFICPSSIENSPNSLGEAQILGVPCIASYAGGIPDLVEHNKTGILYRFDDIPGLSWSIRRLFRDDEFAEKLSVNGMAAAIKRHDVAVNTGRMSEIYSMIRDQDLNG